MKTEYDDQALDGAGWLSKGRGAGRAAAIVAAVALCAALTAPAGAAVMTIEDENSSVDFDFGGPGIVSWTVDGVENMSRQWLWYRVGGAGPEAVLAPSGSLALDLAQGSDTDFDGDDDTMFARYLGSGFKVEAKFMLQGTPPGSGIADLTEQIEVFNTGGSDLEFHIFRYADLDLGGTVDDASVVRSAPGRIDQTDIVAPGLAQTVALLAPSRYEVGVVPGILNSLSDGSPTTLGNVAGPVGPGNLCSAFQWDFLISPGGSEVIGVDTPITVPEPGAALLTVVGLVGLLCRRRRKTPAA